MIGVSPFIPPLTTRPWPTTGLPMKRRGCPCCSGNRRIGTRTGLVRGGEVGMWSHMTPVTRFTIVAQGSRHADDLRLPLGSGPSTALPQHRSHQSGRLTTPPMHHFRTSRRRGQPRAS